MAASINVKVFVNLTSYIFLGRCLSMTIDSVTVQQAVNI
jgi:hypothetical protein